MHLEDVLDDGKRIALVIPGSAGDVLWVNSLISNMKKMYQEFDLYVFTKSQFYDYIEDNPDVHKVLPYSNEMDSAAFLEGRESHKGYFDMAFFPHHGTQRLNNYHHNGIDRTQFELCEN